MFKVRKFQFLAAESQCRSFSIWNFCPTRRWEQLWELIGSCTPCRYEFFPYIFWLVLIISVTGAYRSLGECVHIYCISSQPLEMWRPRKFYVFNMEVLRMSRMVGAIIMSYAWLLMIYALVNAKPNFIMPWLILNTIMLGLDFFFWVLEVLTGRLTLHLSSIVSMFLLLCTLALVNCIKTVFENAIKYNMVETLSVLGPDLISLFL
ncbi:uncharacterized protein LOC6586235 [Drosophila mojavensis]|uniref:Uncharacterized protein n=1 Tax=Drosophila mojavensis TaxID=7230 RepID=B4L8K4_DROMO|nr:uncharacterized protein LOC6586235 [Drosophila mojavensis]EDW07979.1 uncharacterized protein Dmoj_GI14348 [Drosophila mojavensis]